MGEDSTLSEEEVAVLMRGPKLTVNRVLCKEWFLVEMEKCFIKVRLQKRDEDIKEPENAEEERVRILGEIGGAKSRMVFDPDSGKGDFMKQRCSDAKHYSQIILSGPITQAQESELIMRRVEWEVAYDKYIREMSDEEEVKESNLRREEQRVSSTF